MPIGNTEPGAYEVETMRRAADTLLRTNPTDPFRNAVALLLQERADSAAHAIEYTVAPIDPSDDATERQAAIQKRYARELRIARVVNRTAF